MKKLFLFLFLLISFFANNSCKKDKPDEIPNQSGEPKLIASETEVLPYQFVTLQLENTEPTDINAKKVNIKIGDSTAVAYRTTNSNVYVYNFELPELAPGKHAVIMQTAKGEAKTDITVKPYTPIADANKYVQDYNITLENDYKASALEYDSKVQEGGLRQSTADSLKDFVKKAYDKNAALLAQLPESEKKKFAYMYEAN
ncbi:MAG: hypothetical protein ACXWDO_09555, partial [Bacteroidia bacterium]